MMLRSLLTVIVFLVLCGWLHDAKGADSDRNSQPIQIKSNELTTDSAKRTATFTGKVVAKQGDVTIYCDRLVIFYSDKEKEVDKVEAFGNVRILQDNKRGLSEHGVYENKAGKIVLDGNPSVYQGEDVVTGKVITYYLDTQRSEVTSGVDQPVMATIHPQEKRKDGGAKP